MQRRTMIKGFGIAVAGVAGNTIRAEEKSTERPMRRKDRALTLEESKQLILHTPHAVLSTTDSSGTPYGVPITPILVDNDYLVFHGALDPNGRKWVNLRQNPKVSVAFIGRDDIAGDEIPKSLAINFASAIVAGTASQVTDEAEKERYVKEIARRNTPYATAEEIDDGYRRGGSAIQVWKIKIDSISGKARNKAGYFNRIMTEDLRKKM